MAVAREPDAKQRLMPIVRDLTQKVVIGKTPGHQPATLQVHGSIADIMASMEVIDLMGQQFLAAAQNDFMSRLASGDLDTEAKIIDDGDVSPPISIRAAAMFRRIWGR